MDKQNLIDKLNEDLANEFSAIVQYITYAAKATGPYRPQLSQFFLAEVVDEQAHAQFLANKIVALGGEPTTTPAPVPEVKSNREMLLAIQEAERRARPRSSGTRACRSSSRTWCVTRATMRKRRNAS